MTLEAFLVFTTYWYAQAKAQAQAQTQARQGQFPMPLMAPIVSSLEQPTIKLSKLVKEARQLSCETFSGTVDAVAIKNWLKMVSDSLTDMELDDELKLRVATRLIDKNTAI